MSDRNTEYRAFEQVVDPAENQRGYAWVVMSMLWSMDIINVIIFSSVGVLIPIWKDDLGVTPLQAGLLGSAGFLGFGLMALPSSIWLTRYNPAIVTFICVMFMGFASLLHSVASSIQVIIAARFIFVLMSVSRLQMQVVFIQQWFISRLYATVNSLDFTIRHVGQTIGFSLIPIVVISLGSWQIFYAFLGIALLLLSVIWLIFQRNPNSGTESKNGIDNNDIGNPIKVLVRHKSLWLVSLAQSGAALTFGSILTFYPSFAIDRLGIPITSAGILMGIFSIGCIVGSMAAGPMSQYTGRRKPYVWVPGLLLPISYSLLIQTESLPVSAVLLFISGACAMAVSPVLATVPLDMRLHHREVAVSLGLTRTIFPFSATLGTMFVGVVQQNSGSLLLGLAIVAPMPITLFIFGILMPETGPSKEQNPRSIT
jgi:MFS family permease